MFKKAKEITVGELVHERGQSFTVKEVRRKFAGKGGWIAFVDTADIFHGWYRGDNEKWTVGRLERRNYRFGARKARPLEEILKMLDLEGLRRLEAELPAIVRRSALRTKNGRSPAHPMKD